jgi:hypothetical protein
VTLIFSCSRNFLSSNSVLSILAVPISGAKEECVAAVAAFLRNPHEPSVVPRKRHSVGSAEAKEKKAAKAQRKKVKSAKSAKSSSAGRTAAVKTATPYELYEKSALAKAKEANPTMSTADLHKFVAAEWQAQPEAVKAAFESAAASLKDAAKVAAAKATPAAAAKDKVKGGVKKPKAKPKAAKAAPAKDDSDSDSEDSISSSSSSSEDESDEEFGSKKTVKKASGVAAGTKTKATSAPKSKPAPKPKEAVKSGAPAAVSAEDALKSSKFFSAIEDIITSASDEDMESLTKRKIRELLVAKGFEEDQVTAAKDEIAALCTHFVDKRG